jgi:hypothetical protein
VNLATGIDVMITPYNLLYLALRLFYLQVGVRQTETSVSLQNRLRASLLTDTRTMLVSDAKRKSHNVWGQDCNLQFAPKSFPTVIDKLQSHACPFKGDWIERSYI